MQNEKLRKQIDRMDTDEVKIEERTIFACPHCSETFSSHSDVANHFNIEHPPTVTNILKKAIYPFCPTETTFEQPSDLRHHINCYHKEQLKPLPAATVKTEIMAIPQENPAVRVEIREVVKPSCFCGKHFNDKTELGVHIFKCPDWQKLMSNLNKLPAGV